VPEKHQKENANYDSDDGERRPTAVRLLIRPGKALLIRLIFVWHPRCLIFDGSVSRIAFAATHLSWNGLEILHLCAIRKPGWHAI